MEEPEDAQDAARLTVAAVAHRLGIAPSTLRTWDRRYGLGPSLHTAGAHRRYTPEDLQRLQQMRALVLDGVSPAEAARVALSGGATTISPSASFPDREGGLRAPAVPLQAPAPVVLPASEDVVRGLHRTAQALDADAVIATVRRQLDQHGVLATWEQVLVPVLVAVGARWAATGEGVEVEHLLSDCVALALRQHLETRPGRAPARPVLLAGAPDDMHSLPLHVLASALGEAGHASRVLGPAMPQEALHAAVRRTGAAALFVWSQVASTGVVEVVASLPLTRPPTAVVVGGPGWPVEQLPARVSHASDLASAVSLVGRALHG